MRHGDDGLAGEFLPDDALDQCVGDVVETMWVMVRQYVCLRVARIE